MTDEIDHIRRRLADEAEKTLAYFDALPPGAWEQQIYQTGSQWRVREVLAHFISAERAYQKYLGDVLQGGSGAPGDLDIDEFNEAEVPTIKGSPAELLKKFRQVRIDTLKMTESLDDADLTLVANHPWFDEKEISWYLKLLYRHNTMHRMDIQKALSTGQPISPVNEQPTGRRVNPEQ
jgi:hypothetical protein